MLADVGRLLVADFGRLAEVGLEFGFAGAGGAFPSAFLSAAADVFVAGFAFVCLPGVAFGGAVFGAAFGAAGFEAGFLFFPLCLIQGLHEQPRPAKLALAWECCLSPQGSRSVGCETEGTVAFLANLLQQRVQCRAPDDL